MRPAEGYRSTDFAINLSANAASATLFALVPRAHQNPGPTSLQAFQVILEGTSSTAVLYFR
eukprot:scaffold8437_cov111-Cylindrotheca_fusiformis.AAC.1